MSVRLNPAKEVRRAAGRGGGGATSMGGNVLLPSSPPYDINGPAIIGDLPDTRLSTADSDPTEVYSPDGSGGIAARAENRDALTVATITPGATGLDLLADATLADALATLGLGTALTNPMTAAGDLIIEGAAVLSNTTSPTGNVNVVTGVAETLLPGCALTAAITTGPISVAWDAWISQNAPGQSKAATFRLRRTNVSGAVLASLAVGDPGTDSTAGHNQEWASSFVDTAPTDGHYVLTIQSANSVTAIWSDTRTFSVTAPGGPARLPYVADGDFLVGVSGAPAYVTPAAARTAMGLPAIIPLTPSGAIVMWPAAAAPTGWLICNGASLLRASYAALFTVIGTTYGSADGTHFTLPNFASAFPRGNTPGATGGEATHTLTTAEMPSHRHTGEARQDATAGGGNVSLQGANSAATWAPVGRTDLTGGDGAHNNLPPYVGVNFIIKT